MYRYIFYIFRFSHAYTHGSISLKELIVFPLVRFQCFRKSLLIAPPHLVNTYNLTFYLLIFISPVNNCHGKNVEWKTKISGFRGNEVAANCNIRNPYPSMHLLLPETKDYLRFH